MTPAAEALSPRQERRNAVVYGAIWCLIFLSAPVIYIGIVQAALCKRLHASDTMANLPSTVHLAMTVFPILVVWLYPQARLLKRLMSLGYGAMAAAGALVAVVLLVHARDGVIIATLVVHGALVGCGNGLAFAVNWEALIRGTSQRVRGQAMAWAYGCGPGFAVVGSLATQLMLEGRVFGWRPRSWPILAYPINYVFLFGGSAILLGAAALLANCFHLPAPARETERASFRQAVWGGFKAICSHRVLLHASIAYVLMYCGIMVQNNMSLFTREAVGLPAETLAGYQLALRFGFKMVAGFFLGWLLTRTNPKVPLLVTAGLQIAGVLWVLFVPGYWFLIAFGINGAGELFGTYYVNYPVACSGQSDVRRNVAFLGLFGAAVGLAPVAYGWISDTWGLRASFWAALALLAATSAGVAIKLPRHPPPPPLS